MGVKFRKAFLVPLALAAGLFCVQPSLAQAKININAAGAEELESLPGIGPSKARAIIDYREKNGYFGAIEEITDVSGIGTATFEKIKDDITVKNAPDKAKEKSDSQNQKKEAAAGRVRGGSGGFERVSGAFANIIISEIFPNPKGSDREKEFIELYNAGNRYFDLSGWELGDDTAKRFKFKKGTIIGAKKYLAIYRKESGIALNNGGDSAKLYRPSSFEPLSAVSYEKAAEGLSYGLVDSAFGVSRAKYEWSEEATPGEKNIIKRPNRPPDVDFYFPEKIRVGVPAVFDGSDTVDPDGDELFFVWDFGDGFINTLPMPEHTFFKPGIYAVKLTVGDGESEATLSKELKVEGGEAATKERNPESEEGGAVIINEILPDPKGSDAEGEWIELYNYGSGRIDLSGWKIADFESETRPRAFADGVRLSAGEYFVVGRADSGLALNNAGDRRRGFFVRRFWRIG